MIFRNLRFAFFLWLLFFLAARVGKAAEDGKAGEVKDSLVAWPRHELLAEKVWQLNAPQGERFDASGLLLRKNGDLLTINDRGADLYRILFSPEKTNEADLALLPDCFTPTQLAPFAAEKTGRWDGEGIAEDSTGRLYICEEANRWIMRWDPKTKQVNRLPINWAPVQNYFFKADPNASFEGLAIGKGKLFVANERQVGRIFVVHLKTMKIIDNFTVRPSHTQAREIHYSDLYWFDDALFALLRENNVVVKIEPRSHRILAEYHFGQLERGTAVAYRKIFPTSAMEGLAVDQRHIWLVTDNNGLARKKYPKDIRPTLVRCLRPDKP